MSFLQPSFWELLFHVFLLIEGWGGCPTVRLYYPASAGHESMLRVTGIAFVLKDCSCGQLQTLME